jgi:uncharacterized surface protein with fasciclin (FAS1) repeats
MLEPHAARRARTRVAAALATVVVTGGCFGGDDDEAPKAAGPPLERAAKSVRGVTGSLCEALPTGTDPGAPSRLRRKAAHVALQWIPVVTTFESAVRAAGMQSELGTAQDITILAPTDDAVTAVLTQETLDELFISRRRELRALLDAHIVDGAFSLADLRDAETVTTRAGEEIEITQASAAVRLDDGAETVCADYVTANAVIHVIDGVLGPLPRPAPPAGPIH